MMNNNTAGNHSSFIVHHSSLPLPVLFSSPFIPPELIAAHGFRPERLFPARAKGGDTHEGLCPYAHAFVAETLAAQACAAPPAAVIFATTCDQMRRTAGVSPAATFLLNVPATWQSDSAKAMYRDELARLSRFLVQLGGVAPSDDALAATMLHYDDARAEWRRARESLTARAAAEALMALSSPPCQGGDVTRPQTRDRGGERPPTRLALLGGPLFRDQFGIFDEIEAAGARVVLDATETGERTLPAPFDRARLRETPLDELARAYFDHIPDVFRRPNTLLYEWLARELAERRVQGILLLRCVWCDLWHAEVRRLKERLNVPVVELDPSGTAAARPQAQARLQALLEMFT